VSRFAFAVGRHIGKAARRNRVRRRLREVVRLSLENIKPGYDCLLVARTAAATATHEELETAVLQLLSWSGLLIDE
jgi:ribonuclease P protein component